MFDTLIGRVSDTWWLTTGGPFRQTPVTIARPHGPSPRWGQSSTVVAEHHVRVVDVVTETSDAVTLHLEPTTEEAIEFRAGQYLTHCFAIDGDIVKRAYSISTAEGESLACTVKAIDGGLVSEYIRADVAPGHEYAVLGPSGDFQLPPDDAAPLAFLAAGSGITPVISLIETALRADPGRVVHLVYASRRTDAIIFAERLATLEAQYRNFSVEHVLSRPDSGWGGHTGRLSGERAVELLQVGPDTHVFLCGPVGLMDATTTALQVDGVPADRVHRERFYAAPHHTSEVPTEPQPVQFRRSGRTVTQHPGETILDAGLRDGVKLDFSCTVGGCASCKVRVIEGTVTLDEPNCLTTQERAEGYVLSCSAYAQDSAVIDA